MLRFKTPVQVDARTTFEPIEIDGHRVGAGETVVTFLGQQIRNQQSPMTIPNAST